MATTPGPQDQRKRTLDALERRFAVAKAELLQQQKNNKKISTGEGGKESFSINSSVGNASIAPSCNSSSKKGNFSFSGPSTYQDVEENSQAYSQLTEHVHENLLLANSKKGSMTDKILHELLQSGDSAPKYMQGSRSIKIDNWILLDNFVQGRVMSTGSHIRALKNHSNRSKRHMSMKQLKKSGVFELPQAIQKFDTFKPMHEMWKGYMNQLLKITGKNLLAQCLLGADLHGAHILGWAIPISRAIVHTISAPLSVCEDANHLDFSHLKQLTTM
ncbi:hypothetical protein CRYUN_Cryun05aG0242700 [Craigia yunnanensis]